MSMTDGRQRQIFPTLAAAQIETAMRFACGPARVFAPGEVLYAIGDPHVPVWLALDGAIEVARRDGLSGAAVISTHSPGQFSGELSQLAGRPSLVAGRAGPKGCTAIAFDAAHLRDLMIGSADVGEVVMRALILRRLELIEDGGSGSVLVGTPGSFAITELERFLARSGHPHRVLDAVHDEHGHDLIARLGVLAHELPLMVCPNGTVLRNPSTAQVAAILGMVPELDPAKVYDVAIVGAGPAGLAAAVYGASEGLATLVLDDTAMGGQAAQSNLIENYLGFPMGISGQALAGRAFNQALKFGAEIAIPLAARALESAPGDPAAPIRIRLDADRHVDARTVVVASGARYRRPEADNLDALEGAGVSYWASPIEARLCAGEAVALVGGGNAAGEAVVFLAPYVARLHLVVRRPIAQTMARYLVDRIGALPNVELHVGHEIAALDGDRPTGLTGALFRNRQDASERRHALRHLFVLIGADPNSAWLGPGIATDAKGFVRTGEDFTGKARACGRPALPLETSWPGVFAIGDVRAGSTKRVAAGVGEGAAVIAQIHQALKHRSSA